jgi:CRP-like cAMP-binding protein
LEPAPPSRHLASYPDGEPIFTQGEKGDEMYIVQEGHVEIVREGERGEIVPLATLGRGDFFGEMAVLEGAPRTATARSRGGCKVLPLRGALFVEMLQSDPETTLRIMRKLCGRIRELQGRLGEHGAPVTVVGEAAPAVTHDAAARRLSTVRLVHASGVSLALPERAEARVGRPDPAVGSVPDVDLTPFEEARTVSRSHARIVNKDGRLFVLAEAATNGTFVGGERLEPGVPHELRAGDSIAFGKVSFQLQVG